VGIFESFGIVEELLREGYQNEEVAFWNPGGKEGGIVRTRTAHATEPGLSHLLRVILVLELIITKKIYSLSTRIW
jgi:phenol 2-monooxygenase (NADPH)